LNALLDTHTFLWWVLDDKRLSAKARAFIAANDCGVSLVSAWELAIKSSIGKLTLASTPARFFVEHIAKNDFVAVPVEIRHIATLESLPLHHGDPFDRLLVAQALSLSVPIVSADKIFPSGGPSGKMFGKYAVKPIL
jgi:PIN domain nuclease of toxin-antitoxin system